MKVAEPVKPALGAQLKNGHPFRRTGSTARSFRLAGGLTVPADTGSILHVKSCLTAIARAAEAVLRLVSGLGGKAFRPKKMKANRYWSALKRSRSRGNRLKRWVS